jgi:hypothetical protein
MRRACGGRPGSAHRRRSARAASRPVRLSARPRRGSSAAYRRLPAELPIRFAPVSRAGCRRPRRRRSGPRPGEPAFTNHDPAAEVAGPLGADTSPERAFTAGIDNRLRPRLDFLSCARRAQTSSTGASMLTDEKSVIVPRVSHSRGCGATQVRRCALPSRDLAELDASDRPISLAPSLQRREDGEGRVLGEYLRNRVDLRADSAGQPLAVAVVGLVAALLVDRADARTRTGSAILIAADSLRADTAGPASRQVVTSISAGNSASSDLRVGAAVR